MNTPKARWKVAGPEGLYLDTNSGTYYSRYRMNGQRTFRSLRTKVFTVAKLKHAQRNGDVEKDRQRGADLNANLQTLGGLLAELEARFAAMPVAENTRVGRTTNVTRLKQHWLQGNFKTFLARNVTAYVVTELREHLLRKAQWKWKFGRSKRHGFKVSVVNQTLWILRVMLEIAVENMIIIENPFALSTTLRPSLYAQHNVKGSQPRLDLPDRATMLRLFAEMRRVPEGAEGFGPNPEQRVYLERMAGEMADHAELMAYSGMRKEETVASTIMDDCGDEFKIHGTKSVTSERVIPVNPALRVVLDRIKQRRIGHSTKLVETKEPRTALRRACVRLGLKPLTNHHLRHYFASVCIASGVDIPTVSRWLGHADGGALAMKVYGHLLKDHSLAAAKKVDFNSPRIAVQSNVV